MTSSEEMTKKDVLPEEMRIAVTLHYLEGYQIKEIASILGTTESTIKNRLLRARNRLKKELEEMEAVYS